MKNIIKGILNKIAPPAGRNRESRVNSDLASNTGHIYNIAITLLISLSFLVIALMLIFLKCNLLSGVLTFLLVSGASFAGGASIGFLFGLPRAEKYRYIKSITIIFPLEIDFAATKNNKAEIKIQATEAFVAGVRHYNNME